MASSPTRDPPGGRTGSYGISLSTQPEGVREIESWLRENISKQAEQKLRWIAVAHDIGLLLGDTYIERFPTLYWTFHEGRPNHISYQRPVIAGFRNVANPHYTIDQILLVDTFVRRLQEGMSVQDDTLEGMLDVAARV